MSRKNIIVHIGLHKTGTTFLQKHVFTKVESLTMIRAWFTHRNITDLNFKEKILITDEGISGNPWNGRYLEEFKQNVKKIKYLYGDVKIIFGIRKHEDFILSLYKQYLHQKGYENIDYLYNKNNTGVLKSSDLFFSERLKILHEEFTNVFVYSQETLKTKPLDLINSLFSFIDVSCNFDFNELKNKKENVGVFTETQVKWLKKLNYINYKLTKAPLLPSLYNSKFNKYKINPRDICQNRLKNTNSKKYDLPKDLKDYINDYFSNDWNEAISYLSY